MPPSSGAHLERVWTPQLRLYEEDAEVFHAEPFATEFAERAKSTVTRRGASDLWEKLTALLATPRWVQYISDWLSYTLGGEIVDLVPGFALNRGCKLFVEVLWIRYNSKGSSDSDVQALDLLLKAQRNNMDEFRPYIRTSWILKAGSPSDGYNLQPKPPADFCWIDELQQRETWDEDSDAGERDSDWEDASDYDDEDDPMDSDFLDPDYCVEETEQAALEDEGQLPNFVQTASDLNIAALPTKLPPDCDLTDDQVPYQWAPHIAEFFFPEEHMSDLQPEEKLKKVMEPRDKTAVVVDLVAMRKLGPKVYKPQMFQQALEESGLRDLMDRICRWGNLIETSHADVQDSFRWHDWKISYAEMICRWVAAVRTQAEYDATVPQPDPNFVFTPLEAEQLLQFISAHPRMHPWSYDPLAVYLFLSLECFTINCELWLVPSLQELKYPRVNGWNCETVYRRITNLGVYLNPRSCKEFLKQLDPRLAVVISESSRHKSQIRKVPNAKPTASTDDSDRNSNSDSDSDSEIDSESELPMVTVQVLSPSQIRKRNRQANLARKKVDQTSAGSGTRACTQVLVNVKPRNCKNLIGSALTCARVGNRLRPKPLAKRKKGATEPEKLCKHIRYFHPFDDLHMQLICHRPNVYKRCGKDVVRFIWESQGQGKKAKMVGGVSFEVFSKKTLAQLIDNHRRIKVRAIRRREAMQEWAYGKMTGTGPRMPRGGRQGDGYGLYACHKGDTLDDIRALFRHAVVSFKQVFFVSAD
ncbi:hypothetical protein DFH07DRAFT_783457 [Mycena maculata]|uniref:Uncharacterized protein n=1 Tax=Mycena maculata TaxID=230809 RepID=A0AAD7MMH0_9AGAR|nr:hypothetical protein DFH07DRAFT_783457 [Mycena maculata]